MDNLEKFIKENRSAFDVYKADRQIWRRIKARLHSKYYSTRILLFRAAMILIIFGTAFTIYKLAVNRTLYENITNDNSERYLKQSQFKETEIYYNNLINNLYRKASPLLTGSPEIENEIKSDFTILDSLCIDIKSDLKDNVDNQEVIEALIQNYRVKIQILEDMLVILQENNKSVEKQTTNEL
jgi:hypothetical protein